MQANIQYHHNLIDRLCSDHQKLVRQATMLIYLANNGNFKLVAAMLNIFKRTLLAHVHEENLKLYIYLQTNLPKSSHEYLQMRELRKEMNNILMGVVDFLEKYQFLSRDRELQQSFLDDFEQITQLLLKRIGIEESSLYPMYQEIQSTHSLQPS